MASDSEQSGETRRGEALNPRRADITLLKLKQSIFVGARDIAEAKGMNRERRHLAQRYTIRPSLPAARNKSLLTPETFPRNAMAGCADEGCGSERREHASFRPRCHEFRERNFRYRAEAYLSCRYLAKYFARSQSKHLRRRRRRNDSKTAARRGSPSPSSASINVSRRKNVRRDTYFIWNLPCRLPRYLKTIET